MILIELLEQAEQKLASVGIDSARLDAELLLAHTLNCERIDLYLDRTKVIGPEEQKRFKSYLDRRLSREPVAYIRGFKEFHSLRIEVSPKVLIPRPETEILIEKSLELLRKMKSPSLLDICTGSGCIAAAIAKHNDDVRITATDRSKDALNVARKNLAFAADRVELLQGDLFDALTNAGSSPFTIHPSRRYDLITANPPYARDDELTGLEPELGFEPRTAIVGGPDGLDLCAKIINDAPSFLNDGGWLMMEIGLGQADKAVEMAEQTKAYSECRITKDLAGIDRVVSMQFNTGY